MSSNNGNSKQDSSVESVAFELMKFIGGQEYHGKANEQENRDYWKDLYLECRSTVKGISSS